MGWIRDWIKVSSQESFRVKTKLNSEEAGRRFKKIQQNFTPSKERIMEVCKEEMDTRLEGVCSATEMEISLSVQLLNEHYVGEREYLGSAVLTFEGIVSKTKDLLLRVELARQTGQRLPYGFGLRAQGLADQLRYGCRLLIDMRRRVEQESRMAVEGTENERWTGWTGWARLWGRGTRSPAMEEHHEREHLFTGLGWRKRQGCRCLDYR
ncbi:hypothetical protein A1O1_07915 [Capronia coronata CBS 617.96]|uniref:Uncharacterized protein n=1 Tax=Capronia coronata CBS 617.96 TaxID=1182541 RepID=W9XWZ0_9EURO|nr:uncharacterized protein A1O1_07915 [Capronia coronata CBS 617.96]EXJ81850.1 hypothetical protein A1O1_07915 [Capronia coronata CBS 617.96]